MAQNKFFLAHFPLAHPIISFIFLNGRYEIFIWFFADNPDGGKGPIPLLPFIF